MPNNIYADYFLGANSPNGFCSMFEQSYSADQDWQVFIIKGGPGTGKSTLMRTIAQCAADVGQFAERIHCSSDPDSLDAVILPERKWAIYDGTAPHVLEPSLPGACERIIDLGRAWDADLLHQRREDIAHYSRLCSACHRRATLMLACAEVFRARLCEPTEQAANRQKISRAAERLCQRFELTRRSSTPGSVSRRLCSAVTPAGVMTISQEYIGSFGRIVPILDRYYSVSGFLLTELRDRLLERGYNLIECPCSQNSQRIEHLLLPEEDICFTVRSDAHGLDDHTDSDARAIRAERFLPVELTSGRHPLRTADRREMLRFTDLAANEMRQAKSIHDELETCYRDAMDFDLVTQISHEAARAMLG